MSSGRSSSVTHEGQMSFEQQEAERIAEENERNVQERIEYLKNDLPKSSPISIP